MLRKLAFAAIAVLALTSTACGRRTVVVQQPAAAMVYAPRPVMVQPAYGYGYRPVIRPHYGYGYGGGYSRPYGYGGAHTVVVQHYAGRTVVHHYH